MDRRSVAERHEAAAMHVRKAITELRKAADDEGTFEWGGQIRESITELEFVGRKLIEYAQRAVDTTCS